MMGLGNMETWMDSVDEAEQKKQRLRFGSVNCNHFYFLCENVFEKLHSLIFLSWI